MKSIMFILSILGLSNAIACHELVGSYSCQDIDEEIELSVASRQGQIVLTTIYDSKDTLVFTEGDNLLVDKFIVNLACGEQSAKMEYRAIDTSRLIMTETQTLNQKRDLVRVLQVMGTTDITICKRK